MKIEINLGLLTDNELSPDEFVLIKLLVVGKHEEIALSKLAPDLISLANAGWLEPIDFDKWKGLSDLRVTKKTYDLLQIEIDEEFYENLADTFSKLWEGTKPGTISATDSIIRKLKWFFREYQFDAETVKTAAAYYVSREQANSNYKFLKSIANFIEEKDGQSMLYSYCLSIEQGDNTDSNVLA